MPNKTDGKNAPSVTTGADRQTWQAQLGGAKAWWCPPSRATHHERQLSVCNLFHIITRPSKSALAQYWLNRFMKI